MAKIPHPTSAPLLASWPVGGVIPSDEANSALSDLRSPIDSATEFVAANPSLRRGQLGDQRAPAREKEPTLLGQRDVALAAAADAKVLPQFIERHAESRR